MSDILEYDGTMIDCFIIVKEEKLYQIWLQDNISVNKSIAAKWFKYIIYVWSFCILLYRITLIHCISILNCLWHFLAVYVWSKMSASHLAALNSSYFFTNIYINIHQNTRLINHISGNKILSVFYFTNHRRCCIHNRGFISWCTR